MKKSEYELLEPSVSPKSADKKHRSSSNVLSEKDDHAASNESVMDEMESYKPTQEMDFEVDEIKECLEKKKKRRNYIEFRPDYEKSWSKED